MKKYELIIFDCDGTLVDTEPLTNELIAMMINERNISVTKEECLNRFAGKSIQHITDFIKESKELDVVAFESEYRHRCLALFNDQLQAIEGAKQLLESLTIPFCIASNGPKVKMNVTLPASGLGCFFNEKNTFSAYDIDVWKPKPDLFLHAAKSMGVTPDQSLVIEDTWSGVMGAVNSNIDVWAYNPHLDRRLYIDGVANYTTMYSIQVNIENGAL